MLELAFSEQSLEVQRGVVMEEFKQRCLNQPYGDVGHLFRPLAYQGASVSLAYYRQGTLAHRASHAGRGEAFFYRFYAPNNAILAVTGNISHSMKPLL